MKVYVKHYQQEVELTDEQEHVVMSAITAFRRGEQLFQYAAPAGCGKSLILHIIIQELGYSEDEIAPMAYMGSAAMVMRKNGFLRAKTCHSWLFTPVVVQYKDELGRIKYKTTFVPKPLNPLEIKLIVIDEGSMIPYHIRKVIEANQIPVLVCGDLDQLQPIASKSAYLTTGKVERLTKIMRQAKDSGIVYLSNMIKQGYRPKPGDYKDVLVIPYENLTTDMLLKAESIICGYNATRENITTYMRDLLGFKGPLPYYGEKIVCRENHWEIMEDDINLVNGLIGVCISNDHTITRMKTQEIFTLDFKPMLFPNISFKDIDCNYQYFIGDSVKRQQIKEYEQSHLNITRYNKFEFGYAITTHMSQGNQYKNGIYIEQLFNDPSMQYKLNYTGITRFIDHCIYVLPQRKKIRMPPPSIAKEQTKCVMFINGQPQI